MQNRASTEKICVEVTAEVVLAISAWIPYSMIVVSLVLIALLTLIFEQALAL